MNVLQFIVHILGVGLISALVGLVGFCIFGNMLGRFLDYIWDHMEPWRRHE